LQHAADFFSTFEHVRKHGLADDITQSRLGSPIYRALVVSHIQGRPLGVYNLPEQNCIYIYRHRVFCKGFFGPKHKRTDLFDGKIWIDNKDFAIVKITGRLAKSPSFWIKQVDFLRNYQEIDGFWLLSKEEAVSATRIFGKETLTIDYQNYTVNGSGALRSLSSDEGDPRADWLWLHLASARCSCCGFNSKRRITWNWA
jgi:hypothetical protein